MEQVGFDAEIVEIKVKKTVDVERLYRIVIETNQPIVLKLQEYVAQLPVHMEVKEAQ